MPMPFKPQIDAIEKIEDEQTRACAAVGAVILTASAIERVLLLITRKLLPVESAIATEMFSKARNPLWLVDLLMGRSSEVNRQTWKHLRPAIVGALEEFRNLSAHGDLSVEPVFTFTGVPGPAGFMAASGFDVSGVTVTLQQTPELVDAEIKDERQVKPAKLIAHLRIQAQTLADIRSFEANLKAP